MNKKTKPTVTIGIAAYNEEENIAFLLKDIILQSKKDIIIEKILVSSDGSSDDTVRKVKELSLKKLQLFDNKERKGKWFRENEIIKLTKSDILIIIDADIMIDDVNFFAKLIKPISKGSADMTSSVLKTISPKRYFEKIISFSIDLKNTMFEKIRNGSNVYTCHGACRAFSKNIYNKITFESGIGEDAYSYLFCITNGYKYEYASKAVCYFKCPDVFTDHEKQSTRFFQSKTRYINKFGKDVVNSEYKIPLRSVYPVFLDNLFKSPMMMFVYISITAHNFLVAKIRFLLNIRTSVKWDIAISSKKLR